MTKLERLRELVAARKAIRLTMKHRPAEKIHGIPLASTSEFLLLHEIHEFHLDGYLVVPLKNIRGVRTGEAEATIHRILEAENALTKLGLEDPVALNSYADLFSSLQALGRYVVVEAWEPSDDRDWVEDFFLIGRVVNVTARTVAILNFDPTGKWDSQPRQLPYKNISSINFDNEYINTFAKYVK